MKKIILLILISILTAGQLMGEAGVAFDDDQIGKEIVEKIEHAKEKGSRFNIVGSVSKDNGSHLIVNGELLKKLSTTKIIGKLEPGSNVKVKGFIQNGEKVLTHIIVSKKNNNVKKLKDEEGLIFDGYIVGAPPQIPAGRLGS